MPLGGYLVQPVRQYYHEKHLHPVAIQLRKTCETALGRCFLLLILAWVRSEYEHVRSPGGLLDICGFAQARKGCYGTVRYYIPFCSITLSFLTLYASSFCLLGRFFW